MKKLEEPIIRKQNKRNFQKSYHSQFKFDVFFFFANFLTFSRIGLIPLIIFFTLLENSALGILFYMIALITDFLDGKFARKSNKYNKNGLFFDVTADYLLMISLWAMIISIYEISFSIIILTTLYFIQFVVSVKIGKIKYDFLGKYYGAWHMGVLFIGLIIRTQNYFSIAVSLTIIYTLLALFSRYGNVLFTKNNNSLKFTIC